MPSRSGGDPLFFEAFRVALADAPAGLVRAGPPASEQALATAEAQLGPLPAAYAAFLRSFDGADLFNEALLVCGVGPEATRYLVASNAPPRPALAAPDEVLFAETAGGDRFLLARDGAVMRLRIDAEERWLAGSTFGRWLEATLARELMLYDDEGEFLLGAFEEDGEELRPTFALRQAERAARKDPGSAEAHHDLGLAHRRLGKQDRALAAFAEAARLDPGNPWPAFDEGRAALAADQPRSAAEAFRRAARCAAPEDRPRLLVWAARAYRDAEDEPAARLACGEAEAGDPALRAGLTRAAQAAAAEDDLGARDEAAALLEALDPPRRRLPLLGAPPSRRG